MASIAPIAKLTPCLIRYACSCPPVSAGRWKVADHTSRPPIAASATTPMTSIQSICQTTDRGRLRAQTSAVIAPAPIGSGRRCRR
jgi:hypothetical protein